MINDIQVKPMEQDAEVDVTRIWSEFEEGRRYNEEIGLYEDVQACEDFYNGRQWEGLKAQDLDCPVFNELKRVAAFFNAHISSDSIGIHMEYFGNSEKDKAVLSMLDSELQKVMELTRFKAKLRWMLRDSIVKGDGCIHYYFDSDDKEGQDSNALYGGSIKAELMPNYRVYFGNPQDFEVFDQPWIILEYRELLKTVKRRAKENGSADWESIQADRDDRGVNTNGEKDKVTVLLKYWRDEKTGHIFKVECTRTCVISPAVDTWLSLYPIAWMPWERVENRYHGQSTIKALIPNQIFINKLYAMAMHHVKQMAFPKIAYNRTMLPGGWSNRVGEAIPVNGEPNMAVSQPIGGIDMSGQVMQLIQQVISDTRETMGASDATLGNVKPDNTSAIIATQKATEAPLELQKMEYFDFVEYSIRVWLDMMSCYYGERIVPIERPVVTYDQLGQPVESIQLVDEKFDFSMLNGLGLKLNVDVGAGTFYSQQMQVQILNNLYTSGILTDPRVFIEQVPNEYLKDKASILKSIDQQKQQAQMAALMQQAPMAAQMNQAAGIGPMPAM